MLTHTFHALLLVWSAATDGEYRRAAPSRAALYRPCAALELRHQALCGFPRSEGPAGAYPAAAPRSGPQCPGARLLRARPRSPSRFQDTRPRHGSAAARARVLSRDRQARPTELRLGEPPLDVNDAIV